MSEPSLPRKRQWTLEAAREILGDVRRRTEKAVGAVDERLGEIERAGPGSKGANAAEQEIQRIIGDWSRAMEALGVEVKGAWLIDFDTGSGFYCWRWPEEGLEHFHGYDEGFAGRVRIQ